MKRNILGVSRFRLLPDSDESAEGPVPPLATYVHPDCFVGLVAKRIRG